MSKNIKPPNEIAQSLQTNLLNKSIEKPQPVFLDNKHPLPLENNQPVPAANISDDQKMYFLIQQLHSLEGMLSNTREELMKLESSLNVNDKSNALAGLFQNKNEEIDFFSDGKHHNNIFNEFFLYENSLMNKPQNDMMMNKNSLGGLNINNINAMNGKRKNSFELAHEAGSDLFKKQKLNMPEFDLNSLNFLNNILEDM